MAHLPEVPHGGWDLFLSEMKRQSRAADSVARLLNSWALAGKSKYVFDSSQFEKFMPDLKETSRPEAASRIVVFLKDFKSWPTTADGNILEIKLIQLPPKGGGKTRGIKRGRGRPRKEAPNKFEFFVTSGEDLVMPRNTNEAEVRATVQESLTGLEAICDRMPEARAGIAAALMLLFRKLSSEPLFLGRVAFACGATIVGGGIAIGLLLRVWAPSSPHATTESRTRVSQVEVAPTAAAHAEKLARDGTTANPLSSEPTGGEGVAPPPEIRMDNRVLENAATEVESRRVSPPLPIRIQARSAMFKNGGGILYAIRLESFGGGDQVTHRGDLLVARTTRNSSTNESQTTYFALPHPNEPLAKWVTLSLPQEDLSSFKQGTLEVHGDLRVLRTQDAIPGNPVRGVLEVIDSDKREFSLFIPRTSWLPMHVIASPDFAGVTIRLFGSSGNQLAEDILPAPLDLSKSAPCFAFSLPEELAPKDGIIYVEPLVSFWSNGVAKFEGWCPGRFLVPSASLFEE